MKRLMLGLAIVTGQAVAAAPFADGDRVVFLGDSITRGGRYHEFVRDYYVTRFPDRDIRFINSGVSGDVAPGGLRRVPTDVTALEPTQVFVHFGMNDINRELYAASPTRDRLVAAEKAQVDYRVHLGQLADAIRSAVPQATLSYLTPTPYDDTTVVESYPRTADAWAKKNNIGCSAGLALMAGHVLARAAKEDAFVVDWYTPLKSHVTAHQAEDPHYRIVRFDRVHPEAAGHSMMAWKFLEAQGVPSLVSAVTLDAAAKTGSAENASLDGLTFADGTIAFDLRANALPFPVASEANPFLSEFAVEETLNRETLQVKGLTAGGHELRIDGEPVGVWSAEELAQGVSLGFNEKTPQYRQAQEVFALSSAYRDREQRLRNERTAPDYAARRAALLAEEPSIRAAARPRSHRYELKDCRKTLTAAVATTVLLPSPFLDNLKRERAVMESLDPMNLTWTCRVTAGLDDVGNTNAVQRLGGWERPDMELRGHTLGHWLSGMAVLGGCEGGGGDRAAMARDKAAVAVHQLKLCQDALGTGWVGAFPESDIDKIIAGVRVWAPWYVQHKILQGLLDQYELCGNEEALEVAKRFGDWAARKVLSLTPEQATTMRKREFGGIGESLRNLARITGETRYDRAAEVFDDPRVLDPLRAHRDCLNGQHANTFIPKVIAALRDYENHGDAASRDLAEFFWQTVMEHYLYAPGYVSTKEAFRGPDRQGANLTGVTGETCCTYNLLKLSRQLFEIEPRAAIADYQERALWNHILAQPEPVDGRVTYFLPMMTGAYQLQNRGNDCFWCCQASAMESHVKVGRLIYADVGGTVYVNQWIPSTFDNGRLQLRLETDFPKSEKATLRVMRGSGTVAVRRPWWAAEGAPRREGTQGTSSYDCRDVTAGDMIEIDLSCGLRVEATPDRPDRQAVFYGPILLAGRLGTEGLSPWDIRSLNYFDHDYKVPPHLTKVALEPLETWTRLQPPPRHKKVWDDASYEAEPYWGEPTFQTPSGLVVSPLWSIHNERYVVYWN